MDGTTDRITAPGAGVMELDFCVYFSSVTSAGYVQLRIYKNGSNTNHATYPDQGADHGQHLSHGETRIAVVAGDYFQLPSKTKPAPA
jgi:hypothetical protein